jgi:hypothetical protein
MTTSHLEVDDEFIICLCSHLPFELYLQDRHKATFVFKNTKKENIYLKEKEKK